MGKFKFHIKKEGRVQMLCYTFKGNSSTRCVETPFHDTMKPAEVADTLREMANYINVRDADKSFT